MRFADLFSLSNNISAASSSSRLQIDPVQASTHPYSTFLSSSSSSSSTTFAPTATSLACSLSTCHLPTSPSSHPNTGLYHHQSVVVVDKRQNSNPLHQHSLPTSHRLQQSQHQQYQQQQHQQQQQQYQQSQQNIGQHHHHNNPHHHHPRNNPSLSNQNTMNGIIRVETRQVKTIKLKPVTAHSSPVKGHNMGRPRPTLSSAPGGGVGYHHHANNNGSNNNTMNGVGHHHGHHHSHSHGSQQQQQQHHTYGSNNHISHSSSLLAPTTSSTATAVAAPAPLTGWAKDQADSLLELEYREEIFLYMKQMEKDTMAVPEHMDLQPELTWDLRPLLVDFLIEIHNHFNLQPETLYLAMNMMDRYLSKRVVYKKHYQLVGMTSLWISSKYEDSKERLPSVSQLCKLCSNTYDEAAFITMERHILKTLDYGLGHPSAEAFLKKEMGTTGPEDQVLKHVAQFLMELTMFQRCFLSFGSSTIATSALFLAQNICRKKIVQLPSDPNLFTCIQYLDNSLNSVSKTVHEKYARSRLSQASILVKEWVDAGGRAMIQSLLRNPSDNSTSTSNGGNGNSNNPLWNLSNMLWQPPSPIPTSIPGSTPPTTTTTTTTTAGAGTGATAAVMAASGGGAAAVAAAAAAAAGMGATGATATTTNASTTGGGTVSQTKSVVMATTKMGHEVGGQDRFGYPNGSYHNNSNNNNNMQHQQQSRHGVHQSMSASSLSTLSSSTSSSGNTMMGSSSASSLHNHQQQQHYHQGHQGQQQQQQQQQHHHHHPTHKRTGSGMTMSSSSSLSSTSSTTSSSSSQSTIVGYGSMPQQPQPAVITHQTQYEVRPMASECGTRWVDINVDM